MIASFGMNLGLLLGGARVFYAMAQDGLFLKSAGTLHPRYRTPAVALAIQGIWIAVLCLSGTFAQLVDFTLAASLIFYVLTPIALFVLRFRHPELERPVRVWGYPVVPALYTLATAAVGLDLVLLRPAYTLPGLVLVLLGIPVYLVRKHALERAAAQ